MALADREVTFSGSNLNASRSGADLPVEGFD